MTIYGDVIWAIIEKVHIYYELYIMKQRITIIHIIKQYETKYIMGRKVKNINEDLADIW